MPGRPSTKKKGPEPISTVLAELMARRGLGRVVSTAHLEKAWREAAGELAAGFTRVGAVRRGKLEVIVANSTLVQELVFQKITLLENLQRLLPDETINELRFRVGTVE